MNIYIYTIHTYEGQSENKFTWQVNITTNEPTPFVIISEEFIVQLITTCFQHWNKILAVTKLKIARGNRWHNGC